MVGVLESEAWSRNVCPGAVGLAQGDERGTSCLFHRIERSTARTGQRVIAFTSQGGFSITLLAALRSTREVEVRVPYSHLRNWISQFRQWI